MCSQNYNLHSANSRSPGDFKSKKTDCLVSVIIPVFNVRPYLRQSLDSILGQTYTNLEILIIDDGSTDGSGEICDEYQRKDPRVLVIHQENRGLSVARNIGLDAMSGEFTAFMDSDDYFEPDMIRIMVRILREKNVDIAACGITRFIDFRTFNGTEKKKTYNPITPVQSVLTPAEGYYSKQSFLESMLSKNGISAAVWNKVYRSCLFHGVRFPDGHVYEDVATFFKIADHAETFYAIPSPLVHKRNRIGSITRTISLDNIKDRIAAYRQLDAYIRKNTPAVFDSQLMFVFRLKYFRVLQELWSLLCIDHTPAGTTYRKKLRKKILRMETEVSYADFIDHAKCKMIRWCPGFYSHLYLMNLQYRHKEYAVYDTDSPGIFPRLGNPK